ncbi:MAG: ABC transporter ATP-binding protein [Desulfobulbaceae bacterium]
MLILDNLHVSVGDRPVLNGINLTVDDGETVILLGPNGSGKTTLLMAVMGMPEYRITKGRIIFNGKDISGLPPYERARLGIGMSFQRPPTIRGLKTGQLARLCARNREIDIERLADRLDFRELLDRDINDGFSGGEIKRSELLQLMAQNPRIYLFDEPESGVDLDNLSLIGRTIRSIIKDGVNNTSAMIITHTGAILDSVPGDCGYILLDGAIRAEGDPRTLLAEVRRLGYRNCVHSLSGVKHRE